MVMVPESVLLLDCPPTPSIPSTASTSTVSSRSSASAACAGGLPDKVQWLVGFRQGLLTLHQWTRPGPPHTDTGALRTGAGPSLLPSHAAAASALRDSMDVSMFASAPAADGVADPPIMHGACGAEASGRVELLWHVQLGSLPLSLAPRGWARPGCALAVSQGGRAYAVSVSQPNQRLVARPLPLRGLAALSNLVLAGAGSAVTPTAAAGGAAAAASACAAATGGQEELLVALHTDSSWRIVALPDDSAACGSAAGSGGWLPHPPAVPSSHAHDLAASAWAAMSGGSGGISDAAESASVHAIGDGSLARLPLGPDHVLPTRLLVHEPSGSLVALAQVWARDSGSGADAGSLIGTSSDEEEAEEDGGRGGSGRAGRWSDFFWEDERAMGRAPVGGSGGAAGPRAGAAGWARASGEPWARYRSAQSQRPPADEAEEEGEGPWDEGWVPPVRRSRDWLALRSARRQRAERQHRPERGRSCVRVLEPATGTFRLCSRSGFQRLHGLHLTLVEWCKRTGFTFDG